jgi:predicted component of type VI protein secretion system
MAVTVIVRTGAPPGGEPPSLTFDGGRIVLGRGRECDVRLPDPRVARRHTTVRPEKAGWALFDEGALNGTFVGDLRLAQGAPHALKDGEMVRIGPYWLELRVDPALPTRDIAQASRQLTLELLAERLRQGGESITPRVLVPATARTPAATLELGDEAREYRVGPGGDVALPEARGGAPTLAIVRRRFGVFVRSLGGAGALVLGSEPLAEERETPWRPGVPLRWESAAGSAVLALEDPLAGALAALDETSDEPLPAASAPPQPARPSAAPAPAPAEAPRKAPLAAPQARPLARERSWTSLDVGVLLLAGVVLAASIAGLVLLLSK